MDSPALIAGIHSSWMCGQIPMLCTVFHWLSGSSSSNPELKHHGGGRMPFAEYFGGESLAEDDQFASRNLAFRNENIVVGDCERSASV
jgi:hypothetical protein